MRTLLRRAVVAAAAFAAATGFALAQTTEDEVLKYRRMIAEDNPGELWEIRGEALFKQRRGPKNASLEQCDFGMGPGVVKGAYARLPRYFADADRVMDMETRLVHCMVALQGFAPKDAVKTKFGDLNRESDIEALATYIAAQSNHMPIDVRLEHAKEREAYKIGETLFYRRMSKMDFACATCHADQGKRIRLQDLYNATNKKEIDNVMRGWPAYRVSNSTVRTMQHRLFDCGWQMRLPNVEFGSEWTVALHTYLSHGANGAEINVPGMRR
jgi:sulfur-oxidizing protein SoxA